MLKGLRDARLDFVRNGSPEHIPGNMSLSFKDADGEMLLHRLDLMGICVSTGSACDSKNTQISHVLKAIKLDECYAKGTIRISLGKENTKEDINVVKEYLDKQNIEMYTSTSFKDGQKGCLDIANRIITGKKKEYSN